MIKIFLPHNGRDEPGDLEVASSPPGSSNTLDNVEEILAGLTPKQAAFVLAYTGEAKGNAAHAARLAGYEGTPETLASVGCENLRKPHISGAIQRIHRAMHAEAIASVEEVQAVLSEILRDRTLEPGPRVAAADKLLRASGAYLDRVEHRAQSSVMLYMPENARAPMDE